MTPNLLDSHCHLQAEPLRGALPEVLEAAVAAGSNFFICNGSAEHDWDAVAAIAREHPMVLPAFGLHPWYVQERTNAWLQRLEERLRDPKASVGEIGLDRWVEPRDEAAQEECFKAQLRLAANYERPASLHCLRAWDWLLKVLESEKPLPAMLIHAYGGSADMAARLSALGCYFSFAGTILDPRRDKTRRALLAVPRDRLLLETDAPDLPPPAPYRAIELVHGNGDTANHPANLPAIVLGVADLLGESPDSLREQLWENAKRLFPALTLHEKEAHA